MNLNEASLSVIVTGRMHKQILLSDSLAPDTADAAAQRKQMALLLDLDDARLVTLRSSTWHRAAQRRLCLESRMNIPREDGKGVLLSARSASSPRHCGLWRNNEGA